MALEHLLLTAAVLAVAFLYSTVGHAGASGYIAVMTIAGLAPAAIKPTALILNVIVACIAFWQFQRAGHFSWRLFWPFAALSVPAAFVGGAMHPPTRLFGVVVGVVLLYSAVSFLLPLAGEREPRPPAVPLCLAVGGILGFVSGLVGVGGGIFLTPLLVLAGWARARPASAVSALFILVNSIAGLAGAVAAARAVPPLAAPLAAAVIAGGAVGSYLGSRRFSVPVIRRLLACVLLVASAKLLLA